MKTVAVAMAASLGLVIAGCALDKNVEGAASAGAEPQETENPGPSRVIVAARDVAKGAPPPASREPAETAPGGTSTVDKEPAPASAAGVPKSSNGDEQAVRDAKEAAEDAARKIYGAAVGAASKIREVGRDAVQSVLEAGGREKDEPDVQAQVDEARVAAEVKAQVDDPIVAADETHGSHPAGQ